MAIEGEDLFDAVFPHHRQVDGVACGQVRMSDDDLACFLNGIGIDRQDLVDDLKDDVETRLDGVPSVDGGVTMEDFALHARLQQRHLKRVQSMSMLRRLHLAFRCGVQRLGPLLVTLTALIALGFGAHAALDWHRHGEAGAGFFHLHVHVGHHHHGDPERNGHELPESDSPSDDRLEYGTLTLTLGVAPPPTVAKAERPIIETNDRVLLGVRQLRDSQPTDLSWGPRGPPV